MDAWLESLANVIQNHGWVAFPACFLAGVISSASPCVLAMIPLVIGYVSGYSEGSPKKAIQYSLVFTLGLTITFTILGVIAGALGQAVRRCRRFLEIRPAAGGYHPGAVPARRIQVQRRHITAFHAEAQGIAGSVPHGALLWHRRLSVCHAGAGGHIDLCRHPEENLAYSGGLLLCYALGHWILVLGAGISAGFAQKVLASKGIANFSNYSKKVGGVLLIGVGVYLIICSVLKERALKAYGRHKNGS